MWCIPEAANDDKESVIVDLTRASARVFVAELANALDDAWDHLDKIKEADAFDKVSAVANRMLETANARLNSSPKAN